MKPEKSAQAGATERAWWGNCWRNRLLPLIGPAVYPLPLWPQSLYSFTLPLNPWELSRFLHLSTLPSSLKASAEAPGSWGPGPEPARYLLEEPQQWISDIFSNSPEFGPVSHQDHYCGEFPKCKQGFLKWQMLATSSLSSVVNKYFILWWRISLLKCLNLACFGLKLWDLCLLFKNGLPIPRGLKLFLVTPSFYQNDLFFFPLSFPACLSSFLLLSSSLVSGLNKSESYFSFANYPLTCSI